MAVRDILIYPDPILKTACPPADPGPETDALVQDLVDTMVAAGHSVGVAAPQIGVCSRVAVVDVSKSKLGQKEPNHGLLVMINPEIIREEGEKTVREGCMSIPEYTGNVTRAECVVVQFLDGEGRERVINACGFEAVAIQHELDHLDGLLFLDRVSSLKTDVFRRKK